MTVLWFLLRNWKLVAIGVLAAGAAALYLLYRAESARATLFREQRDRAEELAEQNAEGARRIATHAAHKILELEQRNTTVETVKERTRVIIKRIYTAPPGADGPVADVLRDAIDGLYGAPPDGDPR